MKTAMTSAAAILALMSGPAFADLTPDQLWKSWVEYYGSVGLTLNEGTRDSAGDTTTLRNVTITQDQDGVATNIAIPVIEMQQTGDGNVRVTFDEPIKIGVVSQVPDDENPDATTPVELQATAAMTGAELLASGTPDDIAYDLRAPNTTVTLDSMSSEGETVAMPAQATLTNMVMKYTQTRGEHMTSTQQGTIERVDFLANARSSANEGSFDLKGSLENLAVEGDSVVPLNTSDTADLNALLKAGMSANGTFSFGASNFNANFSQPDETGTMQSGQVTSASTKSALSVSLSADGLSYQGNYEGLEGSFAGGGLPAPMSFASAGGGFDLQGPVMKSDLPKPFKFAYSLQQVTLADTIWGLFDPAGKLPRDPADLDIDISGEMRTKYDLFDVNAMKPAGDPATMTAEEIEAYQAQLNPFDPTSVTINKLDIKALGAAIAATGALSVAEGGSFEQPLGSIHARYEGLEELLGKLADAGLIPPDQLTGARMMLMMFAKPGDTQGVLTTDLEFKEGGSIFANGQQVK